MNGKSILELYYRNIICGKSVPRDSSLLSLWNTTLPSTLNSTAMLDVELGLQ